MIRILVNFIFYICTFCAFSFLQAKQVLKIASYNLYNLFDAQHDEGKDDYTFLPLGFPGKIENCKKISHSFYREMCFKTNWTEAKMYRRIELFRRVIKAMGNLDLLGVQEIENDRVARVFAQRVGFERYIITHSPDRRGIDVALFFNEKKLTYLNHREIVIQGENLLESFKKKPTRNILLVNFRLKDSKGSILSVFVNHWPSQAAPPEKRVAVARFLKKAIESERRVFGQKDHYILALGDFNTLNREMPNAFHNVLSNPAWHDALVDVQEYALQRGLIDRKSMPANSYWYWLENQWNRLDRFVVSQNLLDRKGVDMLPRTFRIFVAGFMRKSYPYKDQTSFFRNSIISGVPLVWDFINADVGSEGYSDHYPIYVELEY